MSECLAAETLLDLLEGRLAPAALARVEIHLDECPSCFRMLAEVAGGDAAGTQRRAQLPWPRLEDGRYELRGEHARGGIGAVLRAYDRRLRREVALKMLIVPSPEARARFAREATITARLQHPSIVTVLDVGSMDDDTPCYTMPLYPGRSLREAILAQPLLADRLGLLRHALAVTEAVAHAHGRGVLHRDLKPSNVLLGELGETVVIDWGLAKGTQELDAADGADGPAVTSADGTRTGHVLGTPSYMPPEQARGERVDERADVYAIGAMLYHLLAARAPFEGDSNGVLAQVVANRPQPLVELSPDVPRELLAIVSKAMARDPADRYPTARELAADLRRFQTGQLVSAHEYTIAGLVSRWIRNHRAVVTVLAASLLVLVILGAVSLYNVLASKRQAQAERTVAVRERTMADARSRDLLLAQARAVVEQDPTLTLAWLREYLKAGGDPRRARVLAGDAWMRGPARWVNSWKIEGGYGVRFLPDGVRYVFNGPGELKLGDARSNEVRVIGKIDGVLVDMAVGPDQQLATCDQHGVLLLWDLERSTNVRLAAGCDVHMGSFGFAADGRVLVSGGREKHLHLIDTRTLVDREVTDLDWFYLSPDGTYIASGTDTLLRIWRIDAPGETSFAPTSPVQDLIWTDDGQRFALLGLDKTLVVMTLAGEVVARLEGAARGSIAFTPDGQTLVQGGKNGFLLAWDLELGRRKEIWRQRHAYSYAQVLPDGVHVLTHSNREKVDVYRLDDSYSRPIIQDANLLGHHTSFDGKRLALTGPDELRVYELDNGPPRELAPDVGRLFTAMVVSVDGKQAGVLGTGGEVAVFDLASGERRVLGHVELGSVPPSLSPARRGPRMAFAPDGSAICVSSDSGTIRVFHLDGRPPQDLRGHERDVYGLAYGGDVHTLLSGGQDGTVRLWDPETGIGRILGEHAQPIRSMAISSSGRRLASSDWNGVVMVWELPAGILARELQGGDGDALYAMAFAPDEEHLAAGGASFDIWLWDLSTDEGHALVGHSDNIMALRFSPDSRSLVSGGSDGTLRLWDVASGDVRVLSSNSGWIMDLDFSPDGERLVVATGRNQALLFDLATGDSRAVLHRNGPASVRFIDGGRRVASGGVELRVWSDDIPADAAGLSAWIDAHTNAVTPALTRPAR